MYDWLLIYNYKVMSPYIDIISSQPATWFYIHVSKKTKKDLRTAAEPST